MAIQKRSKEEKQKRINDLTEKMNEAVKHYQTDPKDEMELLDSLSKFKQYSTRNTLLIKAQYSGAYGVASYKDFQKLGYQVQKGEKSLFIFAPSIEKMFKDEQNKNKSVRSATNEQKTRIKNGSLRTFGVVKGYRTVPVFDITQTDCPSEDYPNLYPNKPEQFDFKGTNEEFRALNEALHRYAEEKGIQVRMGKTDSAAKGYYVPALHHIVVKDTLQAPEQAKVLLHELAHAAMHTYPAMVSKSEKMRTVSVMEYQAEMTAYVVSTTFGLDSEDYSKTYLASWTKRDVEDVVYVNSLEEVKTVSFSMIEEVVEAYNDLTQDRSSQEPLQVEEKIAQKLNFLSDETGENHYSSLQEEGLRCTGIEKETSTKGFSDYTIRLEDKQNHSFYYQISSEKSKKEIRAEWSTEKTGREWLNEDLKMEIVKRKPDLNITNPLPEKREDMQSVSEYTQERTAPEMKR